MSQKIKNAIAKINTLKVELQNDLADIPNMVIRSNNLLETFANGLLHTIGESPASTSSGFSPTPITNLLGDDVTQKEKVDMSDIAPSQADKDFLKKQALDALDTFLERPSDSILESMDDMVIRAVAKKVGLEVSSTVPAKITIAFIEEIKKAMAEKSNIEAAKEKSVTNEIVENELALFETTFNQIASEYGFELDEYPFKDEAKELIRKGIAETLNSGVSTHELLTNFTEEIKTHFRNTKDELQKNIEIVNELISLTKELFNAKGDNYTAVMEVENRKLYEGGNVADLVKIKEDLNAQIKKANAISATKKTIKK